MPHSAEAIRGAALRPFVHWYVEAHGRSGLDRALDRLSLQDRRHFDPASPGLGVSAMQWYPAPVIHRMLDGLLEGVDARQRRVLAASGADRTLAASLDGFAGAAFRLVVSPQVCALFGPTLWHSFYSGGDVRIKSPGRRCHVMEVAGWSGHHGFLCEINNAAGHAIYRAAGCDGVSTEHDACIDRGDRVCRYVIRW